MDFLIAALPIISTVLSVAGLVCMILASTYKTSKMETILTFVIFGNFLVAVSYLLEGNNNGATCCFIGTAMTFINYFFERKDKPIPIWLICIYAAAIIGVNAVVLTELVDILSIIASLTFILCVGQKSGAKYRFWTIINMLLWISFDIIKASYPPLFTHVSLLLFTVVGMILYDRKKEKSTAE